MKLPSIMELFIRFWVRVSRDAMELPSSKAISIFFNSRSSSNISSTGLCSLEESFTAALSFAAASWLESLFDALPKNTESEISASRLLFKAPRTVARKRSVCESKVSLLGLFVRDKLGLSFTARFRANADLACV
jgi:hypothetical protein